jgi:hypothetical protein
MQRRQRIDHVRRVGIARRRRLGEQGELVSGEWRLAGDPNASPLPVMVSSMARVMARDTPRSIDGTRGPERICSPASRPAFDERH